MSESINCGKGKIALRNVCFGVCVCVGSKYKSISVGHSNKYLKATALVHSLHTV